MQQYLTASFEFLKNTKALLGAKDMTELDNRSVSLEEFYIQFSIGKDTFCK